MTPPKPNKKKVIKAWAIVRKGKIAKVGVHVLLSDCPFAIFDNSNPSEGKTIPVIITYET